MWAPEVTTTICSHRLPVINGRREAGLLHLRSKVGFVLFLNVSSLNKLSGPRLSREFDFYGQSHVYMFDRAFGFYGGDDDPMSFEDIKRRGLLRGKTHMDDLKGPTETLIHEVCPSTEQRKATDHEKLAHVAGGFEHGTSGAAKITDGPGGNVCANSRQI